MHALVVDDDRWSGRIAARLMQRRGYTVDLAVDMDAARALLADLSRLSVVLLDINLADGSGEQLLREIRMRDRNLPVIAVTASAMSGDRERFLREGFTAYFSKPIEARTFADAVDSLCRRLS